MLRLRHIMAALAAALSIVACVESPSERETAQLASSSELDEGYDYNTPCGTDGGPSCLEGWCMTHDGCAPGYVSTCDPLFVTRQCEPELVSTPPTVDMCTIAVGDVTMIAPEGGTLSSPRVIAADAADMTGWVDPIGDSGKVKIETKDGSIDAKYTVVKKTKDEIEIKIAGGGILADFDPKDPLVIRLYNACGKQKYSTTGTIRIIGGDKVSLKAGPDDVDVTRDGATGVVTIKHGGNEIKITPKGGGNGATLEGAGAKMDFKKQ